MDDGQALNGFRNPGPVWNRRTLLLTGAASTLAGCTPATRVRALTGPDDTIATLFSAYADTGRFAGVVLAARGAGLVSQHAFGLADRGSGLANTMETRFNVGSLAKPFLATVILSLVQEGLVSLDGSAADYLAELPARPWSGVSLRQLLSHTAGVGDHDDVDGFFENTVWRTLSRRDLLEVFVSRPLLFEPGRQYRYSNFGYSLLAMIAERVTGADYDRLLAKRIFAPAGMPDSHWGHDDTAAARGYVRHFGGAFEPGEGASPSASLGAGDIVTTAPDLHRFVHALSTGQILDPSLVELMFTPVAEVPGRNRSYGLGWEIYRQDGRTSVGHAGLALHMTAVMEYEPASGTVFAILSNVRDDDAVINNVPPPLIRRMQADMRASLRGATPSLPQASLAEAFVHDWQSSGFDAAMVMMLQREATAPEAWQFDPNEAVLVVFGTLWETPADAERFTLFAIERSDQPWLLYETLGDVRSERGDRAGALAAYQDALTDMPDRAYLLERVEALQRTPD